MKCPSCRRYHGKAFVWRGQRRLYHVPIEDDAPIQRTRRHRRERTTADRRRLALIEARAERTRISALDRELFRHA